MTSDSGFVPVESGRLYYEVEGEGPAVTLIHAGVANLRMWDAQVPALAEHHRVIRYDTRGYGRTTTEAAPFSNRQDIADLLDHLGESSTHLVGASRAGAIAIDFTLEFPDRVSSLVPVASGLSGHQHENPDVQPLMERMESLWEAKQWEELVDLEVDYWVDGPGQPRGRADAAIREQVRAWQLETYRTQTTEGEPRVLEPPAADRLGEIRVPTLVVWGDLDESGVIAACERIVAEVPGARGVTIPGAAHMLNLERPEELNRLLLDFFAEVDAARP